MDGQKIFLTPIKKSSPPVPLAKLEAASVSLSVTLGIVVFVVGTEVEIPVTVDGEKVGIPVPSCGVGPGEDSPSCEISVVGATVEATAGARVTGTERTSSTKWTIPLFAKMSASKILTTPFTNVDVDDSFSRLTALSWYSDGTVIVEPSKRTVVGSTLNKTW